MRTNHPVLATCVPFLIASGCGKTSSNRDERAVAEFSGTTEDAVHFEGGPMQIEIYFSPGERVTVGFTARSIDGSDTWSGTVVTSSAELLAGRVSATISEKGVMNPGSAFAKRSDAIATTGTVSLSLKDRRIAGELKVDKNVGGTFSAKYLVMCRVPPAALGQPENGTGDPGSTQLVLDEKFASAQCKPFAAL